MLSSLTPSAIDRRAESASLLFQASPAATFANRTPARNECRSALWLAGLLVLGLGLRAYHYLSDPPVWHDEVALIMNVLDKSYLEHLGPLYYSEAAPPLFLWIEKSVVGLLDDGTFALRLFPFLASCAAFLMLVTIARRFLPASSLFVFALLLGCSDRLLWHACEAKPYAVDMLVGVGLLALFALVHRYSPLPCTREVAGTLRVPSAGCGTRSVLATSAGTGERGEASSSESTVAALSRLLLFLAVLSPVLIFLSFPACFLLGGVALCLLPEVWRTARWPAWSCYGAFLTLLGVSFLLLLLGPIQQQKAPRLMACWVELFPNWEMPWTVPVHMARRLTEVFRYACEPIGNVLVPVALVGAVVMWRRGQTRLLAFLTLPLALTAFAWLLGQYPLGPSRVVVFLAPACLFLVAAGMPTVYAWLRQRGRLATVPLLALLIVPLVQAGYRVVVPWVRNDLAEPSAFVLARRQADEPVAGGFWELSYYCRQLGPLYRPLDPKPTDPPSVEPTSRTGLSADDAAVERLWLIVEKRVTEPRALVASLPPAGEWRIVSSFDFDRVVALYVCRLRLGIGP
jgi:hypothetical protein